MVGLGWVGDGACEKLKAEAASYTPCAVMREGRAYTPCRTSVIPVREATQSAIRRGKRPVRPFL